MNAMKENPLLEKSLHFAARIVRKNNDPEKVLRKRVCLVAELQIGYSRPHEAGRCH